MYISHLSSGYLDKEHNQICLTFYCDTKNGYRYIDVWLHNGPGLGYVENAMYVTDENGDTTKVKYIASEIRKAVIQVKVDGPLLQQICKEGGYSYRPW